MFKKKLIGGAIALCISASLFAGCTKTNNTTVDENKTPTTEQSNNKKPEKNPDKQTSFESTDIKEKYNDSMDV